MPSPTQPKSELLAPAGSLESFFAALEAGADAVYCGLTEFSARAKAKNFDLATMERLNALAHQQGRRLYVALNTLIKEAELPRLLETLAALASFPVDGIIIQDLGLWRLARQHFPELKLHASTQMTIHNAAGVKMLERMGFTRAVLARELSLAEIATIRQQTTLELEHFVHGALCYSISGHCLFSSYLTGHSGNRGRCAQPCRRRYTAQGKTGFYFSTSDLCAISLLPRLRAAGVQSFKIEGRMKNAEYVSTVVAAYRAVLDARDQDLPTAIKAADEALAEAFGRQTTTGLLKGSAPGGLAVPATKGGIGCLLGQIDRVQGGNIFLKTAAPLHVGDRVRVQPQSDMAGSAFTVQGLFSAGKPVKLATATSSIRLETPFRGLFQAGDQVYKVATGHGFTMSAEACQRRLAAVELPALPVRLTVSCHGPNLLRLEAQAAGCQLRHEYEVEMLPATHSPLNRDTLQPTFAKTGQASLKLTKFSVLELPPVAIKPSRLNEVRRDFYAALSQQVAAAVTAQRAQRLAAVRATLLPVLSPTPVTTAALTVVARGSRDLAILEDAALAPMAMRVILPLTPDNVQAVTKAGGKLAHRERILWDIPAVIFADEWRAFQAVVNQLREQGFTGFRLNNLSHFALFAEGAQISVLAGPWLYVLNSQAALALTELGASKFTLSIEDDRPNMAAILTRAVGAAATVIVYSPLALLTSRIPTRLPPGTTLTADSGESLRLDLASGLTVIGAGQDLALTGRLATLRELGCQEFIVDLSAAGVSSKRGQEVMAAVRTDQALPATSVFNFERGLA